jgi:hypothetical protein
MNGEEMENKQGRKLAIAALGVSGKARVFVMKRRKDYIYEFQHCAQTWVKSNSARRDELLEDVSHEHLRNNSKKWDDRAWRAICHYGPGKKEEHE